MRKQLKENDFDKVVKIVEKEYRKTLERKGMGLFISPHETLGVLTEEYWELIEAIKSNKKKAIKSELLDMLVATIHGIASL